MIENLQNPALFREQCYYAGQWHSLDATFPVHNPFDGSLLANVSDMDPTFTLGAIYSAKAAFKNWKAKTAEERANILYKWYELILQNQEDLARILTLEQGKPIMEARGEIAYGAGFVKWFAEEARRAYGDVIPAHAADKRILAIKQPIGVVAAITPWNFPNAMITRKVAPALAAGCTVVIKPAEATPLSAIALAVLAEEAGFPPGVFNVIPTADPAAIGEVLTSDPAVRKLSFTGSTAVGKKLMEQCASTVKKVSLELGGNAPFIVFDNADLEAAVEGAIASKYRNAGQTCVCANRFIVHERVVKEFTERLTNAVQQQTVGNGMDESVTIGPLINQAALEKVERLVQDALEKGATLVTGGKSLNTEKAYFYEPTILAKVHAHMDIHQEEIFGPVAPVYSFRTEQEAIQLANNTPYGLAAYFYGQNMAQIWRVAEALEYGMVGINTGMISTPVAPFGGIKESGIGREGSKYGMEEYMEIKYLCFQV